MESHLGCYILSMAIMLIFVLCIRVIPESGYLIISLAFVAFSSLVVILLSPVEDKNRPIDEVERKVYRKKSLRVLAVELLAFAGLLVLGQERAALIISMAQAVTAVSMLFALLSRIVNIRRKS